MLYESSERAVLERRARGTRLRLALLKVVPTVAALLVLVVVVVAMGGQPGA